MKWLLHPMMIWMILSVAALVSGLVLSLGSAPEWLVVVLAIGGGTSYGICWLVLQIMVRRRLREEAAEEDEQNKRLIGGSQGENQDPY